MVGESSGKGDELHKEGNGNDIIHPKLGMKFPNVDEIYAYWKNYAKQMGFVARKRSSKKGGDGTLKYACFTCNRGGLAKSTASNPLKPKPNTRIGCPVKISGRLDPDGQWQITRVSATHNHELCTSKVQYVRKRRVKAKDRVGGNKVKKTSNSLAVEASGRENVTVPRIDYRIYDEEVSRLQLGEGELIAVLNYFLKIRAQDSSFVYSMDLDEEGRLKNVFWADGRSREAYKEFGDVVTFDSTCLTNKYALPFVYFYGVNHHGQLTLLGCGLICTENTQAFIWLFQTWVACMSGSAPNGLITHQDSRIQKAVEIVFPNIRHRWCLRHVMKKLNEKLSGYAHFINSALQCVVYDSESVADFEKAWTAVVSNYSLYSNDWLSILYNERHRWVPCFVKTGFWAGMSITQRSESLNSFFDSCINSKTTLKSFVEQYGKALRCNVEKENQFDFFSFSQSVPCVTLYEMEKQIQDAYTISKFKEFQNELIGKMYCEFIVFKEDCTVYEYEIREDVVVGETKKRMTFTVSFHRDECEVECNCHMFEYYGIFCKHAISVLIRNDVALIPEKYILRRWRKDVKRSHSCVKINYDSCSATSEQLRYDKMCGAFTDIAYLTATDELSFIGVMEMIANVAKDLQVKGKEGASSVIKL